jgi:hypothetical protein
MTTAMLAMPAKSSGMWRSHEESSNEGDTEKLDMDFRA